jgi:hypothetical protein
MFYVSFTRTNLTLISLAAASLVGTAGCQVTSSGSNSSLLSPSKSMFSEESNIISLEDRSRRKWDNALIADFDQDGNMDIMITEHAYQTSIFWNEGGTFSLPQVVVKGDTHGSTASDYDRDGRIDIIISQGGGGGTKPRFPISFQVNKDRTIEGGEAFEHFERSRGRAVKLIDSDNDGSLNLVTSAFSLPSQKKNGANFLYEQHINKDFDFVSRLPFADRLSYRLHTTDFNNDNDSDLIFYGGHDMVAVAGSNGFSYEDVTESVLGELSTTNDVSSISEIDFDNDGDFDLFITRAKHQFDRELFFDNKNGRFAFFARNEKFQFEDLKIDGDFTLENLQMAYPHFDVFVGKNKRRLAFDVERHGHKNFTLTPEDSKGWPNDISDKGLYIGYVGNGMWRVGGETKSPTAGVIHNVVSVPKSKLPKKLPALLFENRNGKFVDVTKSKGINIPNPTSSSAIGDFNNDGWQDILVVRYGNMAMKTQQVLYMNNAGKSFKRLSNHGVISTELGATGSGAEAFDYDQDGDLDLFYANERGRWHLFTNNSVTNDKHQFLTVNVGKSPSNKAVAQNAVLTFNACGNSYKRVVGSTSASTSHSSNNQLHVGLGDCSNISNAQVKWSTGEIQQFEIEQVNQTVFVGKH